ncbi:MAG: PAS domain-containing protein [Sulfitobacter sp.]
MDNSSETQQTVLTMSKYQPQSGYTAISLVEAYWEALRAGREMPKRAEIDPRGIESALENAFILERVAPGVARLRIAGSHLHDIMGMEARGMPITSFFEHDARMRVAGLLEEVFQTPATGEIFMQSKGSLGQPELSARMILLPLKSDLGDVSRILGCLVSVGEIGDVPRRFDVISTKVSRIADTQPVDKSPKQPQEPVTAKPDEPVVAEDIGTTTRGPSYLRLVHSAD